MMHLIVLAAALLHLQDPAGDAVGDGTLSPPTAPVYANTSDFDLQSVTVTDDANLTVDVTLGSVSNPGNLPNGFSNPVVEVYLDTAPGGAHALLPGSGLSMPAKRGWNVALRVTGDLVYAVTPQPEGDPGSWRHQPAAVDVRGNTLVVHTDLRRPDNADVYALTGVYDPFSQDGWRALSSGVSPWAFSSDSQKAPVVDLLASGMNAQRRAIDSGVLVTYRSPTHGIGWLLLMALGLIVAALGAVLRRRVPREAPARPLAALPAPRDQAAHRRIPSYWEEMPPTEPSFLDDTEEASFWTHADPSVARSDEERAAGDAEDALERRAKEDVDERAVGETEDTPERHAETEADDGAVAGALEERAVIDADRERQGDGAGSEAGPPEERS